MLTRLNDGLRYLLTTYWPLLLVVTVMVALAWLTADMWWAVEGEPVFTSPGY